MELKKTFKNILSLGANSRLESAIENYQESVEQFQKLIDYVEERRVGVNAMLESLVETKRDAFLALRKIRRISDSLTAKDRSLTVHEISTKIERSFGTINNTISAGEIAMNSSKGAGVGVTTAMGAWWLAGTVGTASTGTAISTLSGAAAYNATLAYFGGGSLLAGGGGMAAGTAVLGGLVVLPALVLSGVFSHLSANKKIKEIAGKEFEIVQATEECEKALVAFELISKRAEELTHAIGNSRQAFELELDRVYRAVFPNMFSGIFKSIRKFFTGRYFNAADLEHIQYIGGVASSLAALIDQKIFDESGNPI